MAGEWTYRGYTGESSRVAPIITRLRGWLKAQDPHGVDLGALPSAQHRKQNPRSVHNTGRALDWGPSSDAEGWRLAHVLAAYPDGAQVQLIIWKDYQWGGRNGPEWHHTGRTDHDTHLHIESRGWS